MSMPQSGVAGLPGSSRAPHAGVSRRGSRGAGRLKAIFWLLVLAAGAYVGFKVVPILISNYQLQDYLNTTARFATVNRRSDEDIREDIYREIQKRDIPARREDNKISENTMRGVRISVEYTVPVDLKAYQWNMHFNPSTDNRSIY